MPSFTCRTCVALVSFLIAVAVAGCGASSTPASEQPVAARAAQPQAVSNVEVTVGEGTSMSAALSPDGRTFVIDLQGSLWTMPATGGPAKRIIDELSDARLPAWSPDGRMIAYQSFRDGDWDIWTVAPDGTDRKKLTSGPFDDREPHWSHDGAKVAFSSDRSGNYDIWYAEVKTGDVKQVTNNPANDFWPAWSRDDRELAFSSDRMPAPGVYAVTLTGTERLLAEARGANAPAWGPDGVLYNVVENDESRLMYKGPSTSLRAGQSVAPGENVFPFRAQWGSGSEFFYVADGKIKKRTLGGSSAQPVEFTASFSFAKVPYARKRRNFDNRESRPALGIVKPVISPDGSQVAFVALGDVWRQPVAGGKAEQVTHDRFLDMDPAWSPDGRQLLFSSDRAGSMDLWIRDLRTGSDRRLTQLPGSEMSGAFSPDGARVAFISNVGLFSGDLYTVEVKSGEVKKIHDTVFGASDPSWSPDGRLLMYARLKRYSSRFREGINEFATFPVDGGEDRAFVPTPHRSSDSRTGGGPAWSPDGSMIAFVMEGVLNVMDVDPTGALKGTPRRITTDIAHDPSWTGDSRRILYLSNEKLRMVGADGSQAQDIPMDLRYTQKIPDGRTVVHASRLLDGKASAPRPDVDIIVEGNRIKAIEQHRQDLHTGRVVDASNLTVIPGLIEMHGHLIKEHGEAIGREWLSYGVTTVRNPAAVTPYLSIEDREAVEAGVRMGPRIFASGYQMDGSRIYYPLGLSISSAEQLELELERTRRLDLDLIKTYVRLPDTLQARVAEFAHGIGIPVTSHEIYPAAAFGLDGTEHTSGTSRRGYSPKMTALNYTYEDVLQLMAKSGMAYTPTASLGGGFQLLTQKDPTMLQDPRFRGLFPPWVTNPPAAAGRGGGPFAPSESGMKRTGDIIRNAARVGVTILTGTDAPISPYGLSLQTELQTLVQWGGMTPMQAIQAATVKAAEALAAADDLGSVEPGKLADFIMVDGDPLADIANVRKVRKVMKNGELFDVDALARRGSSD